MLHTRTGSGSPLLLIHGLGGSRGSWDPVLEPLARERAVITVELPGFGDEPPLAGEVSIATLTDAVERFIDEHDLDGVDVVGSSMGARMALELQRRGRVAATVALDPGGFWTDREAAIFGASVAASVRLVRLLQRPMPLLTGNPVTRTALFAQFSAAPWALRQEWVLPEMRTFASAPSFDDALRSLVKGPRQEGMAAGAARGPITIGWGRQDAVTLPRQAKRALARFPDATLHWFERCGHFPYWDQPEETVRVILGGTGPAAVGAAKAQGPTA